MRALAPLNRSFGEQPIAPTKHQREVESDDGPAERVRDAVEHRPHDEDQADCIANERGKDDGALRRGVLRVSGEEIEEPDQEEQRPKDMGDENAADVRLNSKDGEHQPGDEHEGQRKRQRRDDRKSSSLGSSQVTLPVRSLVN